MNVYKWIITVFGLISICYHCMMAMDDLNFFSVSKHLKMTLAISFSERLGAYPDSIATSTS